MGKMKDSSLLKWTQNNKNNKLTGSSEKKEKKKSKEEKNKNWLHTPENLTSGHIAYLVKFLGSTEVDQPKGIEVVKEGIRKLKFAQQIKKAEGTKTPKVELTVSVDGVAIQESKSKKILHQYPLHRISYCADDKAEKRFFSFIAKEAESEKHTCFVFVSDKLAEEITLTIGQAFDLAYKRFLSGKAAESESEKIARLERENGELRQRLKDVGSLIEKGKLAEYLDKNNIKDLVVVGDRTDTVEMDNTIESPNKEASENISSTEADDSAISCTDSKLINFDSIPVTGLDTMTLDDLNDDDFDPRAFDQGNSGDSSDTSDDFNPRSSAAQPQSGPVINLSDSQHQTPPAPVPARLAPPPTLAPRDPTKVSGKPIQQQQPPAGQTHTQTSQPTTTNPFSQPPSSSAPVFPPRGVPPHPAHDPFGMSNFSTGGAAQDPFSSAGAFGRTPDFNLDELDPLKK